MRSYNSLVNILQIISHSWIALTPWSDLGIRKVFFFNLIFSLRWVLINVYFFKYTCLGHQRREDKCRNVHLVQYQISTFYVNVEFKVFNYENKTHITFSRCKYQYRICIQIVQCQQQFQQLLLKKKKLSVL